MVMIIVGILLIAAGGASAIYGVTQNNSWEAQLSSLFSRGSSDPGTVWIIIGTLAVVVGLVLLIAGIAKTRAKKSTSD